MQHMSTRVGRLALALGLTFLALMTIGSGTAGAATGPALQAFTTWGDTTLEPGGEGQILVHMHNVGDEDVHGTLKFSVEVPENVTIEAVRWDPNGVDIAEQGLLEGWCHIDQGRVFECEIAESLPGFEHLAESLRLEAPGLIGAGPISPAFPQGWSGPIYLNVAVSPDASGVGTNRFRVEGGGASTPYEETVQIPFGNTQPAFGPVSFMADVFSGAAPFGHPARQAGEHPFEQRVSFELTKRSGVSSADGTRYTVANGTLKTVEATLPRGMIGNPEAVPKCDPADFAAAGSSGMSTSCPPNTQVGYLNIRATAGLANYGRQSIFSPRPDSWLTRVAIYNLKPPKGVPADFAFNAGALVTGHIYAELDPAQNYAIKTVTPEISSLVQPTGSEVVFWGVPGDPAHDKFRYLAKQVGFFKPALGAPFEGAGVRPFFTNPFDCGFDNGGARLRVDSYQHPGEFSPVEEYSDALNVTGCDDERIRFKPQVAIQPDNRDAGAPTGLDVHLEVPQRNDEVDDAQKLYNESGEAKAIGTPPMKRAVVTFPEGMTLSPSAAQGLGSCTSAEIGLGTNQPVTCPDNSQYGKLILHTPILPATAQPEGFIYIAKQNDNPFHNFLSLYLVIQEPERGILVKIPAKLDLDSKTGRITTTFDDLPQLPVSDMEMRFKGGVRAGLVNPTTCGTKTIRAEFFSWAAPSTPRVVNSQYDITRKPDGSPCVDSLGQRPFKPRFDSGTVSSSAGSFSPFAFQLSRTDDDQEFSQVGVKLPGGLAAKFAGVGICPDAGIAQAIARETVAGDGALEISDPSCPASSQIGTTEVGTGVGVPLSWVPGKVYLAGPYKGAPMSMVVISPAVIGPYDLGVITVRTALNVNPETAQGEALTDPFPQIFQGIPVRIRDIRMNLDRPDFTLNPTNCAEKQITARVTGTGGDLASTADDTTANLKARFQAADCGSLDFKPRLSLSLFGGTHRGAHPKLRAVVSFPNRVCAKVGAKGKGRGRRVCHKVRPGANIAKATVTLPHSEFLDQGHIGTVCTRVQFAADRCPAASVYGYASAKTPLFGQPLEGPVYLRSSSHQLPDLVAALRGPASQPVEIDLDGRIDSVHGRIRNTFEIVPDAPVETFTLTMRGGRKGLLQNSTELCARPIRATADFQGQNGKRSIQHPALRTACGKHDKRQHPKRR